MLGGVHLNMEKKIKLSNIFFFRRELNLISNTSFFCLTLNVGQLAFEKGLGDLKKKMFNGLKNLVKSYF